MNWQQIEKKYPKAWEKWCEWAENHDFWSYISHPMPEYGMMYIGDVPFNYIVGHLLAFFDERGLYIIARPYFDGWHWQIRQYFDPSEGHIASNVSLKGYDYAHTGIEALKEAFTKAFEILEERLCSG